MCFFYFKQIVLLKYLFSKFLMSYISTQWLCNVTVDWIKMIVYFCNHLLPIFHKNVTHSILLFYMPISSDIDRLSAIKGCLQFFVTKPPEPWTKCVNIEYYATASARFKSLLFLLLVSQVLLWILLLSICSKEVITRSSLASLFLWSKLLLTFCRLFGLWPIASQIGH